MTKFKSLEEARVSGGMTAEGYVIGSRTMEKFMEMEGQRMLPWMKRLMAEMDAACLSEDERLKRIGEVIKARSAAGTLDDED